MTMQHILTVNAGSSSIKFALFAHDAGLVETLRGQIEGLGSAVPHLEAWLNGRPLADERLDPTRAATHEAAFAVVIDVLQRAVGRTAVDVVGHRIVHGGLAFTQPVVIAGDVLARLEALNPLAPLHQPHNLAGVRAAHRAFPDALQAACFDTAFHRSHPWVSDTYALPRALYDQGVRRYGFHGLSYEYVVSRLKEIAPGDARGRVVVMHLGNGASMCAIRDGQSIGSSMGFTALDGLPMGTRCGQLDPGVVLYLLQEKRMSPAAVTDLLYNHAGLKGLSGLSQDMRELEAAGTPESAQAIDYFVDRIRRELGAMAAVLSGIDVVVFCGGIGEHAWRIRARVCQGFEWLGIVLDESRNRAGETVVSADGSRVRVLMINTNEDIMIARHAARLFAVRSND
ncbi:acetate kinase [Bradyrhizobium sp. SSBR45G]|uniref:acetate/propionate family kinase n=1 Tax=unclassified Bradyrhizobium TaxID=2631580 RepID=UPI0023429479|nr:MULTISPECIES: acetate/propionate family kinase [unclassified Bradyrhizobium]GLH80256.1 acetate kinase [Bradyrhizobium sp. SSBR45G]GLH87750.1 acetate kinase [Bradyrhizobium sp. SSBR45R]